ncbi:hypothetical protein PENTCL1PPCAC_14810, partial [Pristionchus entomophagus]
PHPIRYGSDIVVQPLPSTKHFIHAFTLINTILVVFLPILFVCLLSIGLLQTLRTCAAELCGDDGPKQMTAARLKGTTARVTVTVITIALCFTLTQGPSAVLVL